MSTPTGPRTVPLKLIRIVVGLALIVVGVWIATGVAGGLIALGGAVLLAELWPEPRPPR